LRARGSLKKEIGIKKEEKEEDKRKDKEKKKR